MNAPFHTDLFGFEIESKRKIMNLVIGTSVRPAHDVCVQIHETIDGRYKAYYKFAPGTKELITAVQDYAQENGLNSRRSWNDALNKAAKAGVLRSLSPVMDFDLSNQEEKTVDELYEEELPDGVKKIQGLDGHMFFLTLYKEKDLDYSTWCVVPPEWKRLYDVINMIVDRIGLEKDYYGAYLP